MYNIGTDILRYVNGGTWQPLVSQNQGKYVVDVYLNNDEKKYKNTFNQSYVIKIDGNMKKDNNLVLLFPRHPDEHKRVLRTGEYKNYHTLGKEINVRLRESVRDSDAIALAVVSQNKIYRFRSLLGTAYVLWATRVNQESVNDQENTIAVDVPIFYELDGAWNIRNIVIFPTNDEFVEESSGHYRMYPIHLKSITNLFPTNTVLFSAEADNRKTEHKTVKTVSADQAEQMSRDLVARRFIEELDSSDLPFDNISDSEDTYIIANTDDEEMYTVEFIQETPRVHINEI